jgi:hypothetical protein
MTRTNSDAYEMVLDGRCDAPPASVFAVLTDLQSHLDWGGRRQRRGFRLTSLRGGSASVGTEFTSAGTIPMSRAHWADRSVVVRAEPASVFEFHTESVAEGRGGRQSHFRWEHRYDIAADGGGSRVAYRMRRTSMTNPPLRMRVPLMRDVTHRVMIPLLCRRGFDNLLAAADRHASERPTFDLAG